MIKNIIPLILLTVSLQVVAQDNSPLSRYGIGDLTPSQNIINRSMGGMSVAYSDYGIIGSPFSINISNPAALGYLTNTKNFSNTIFDVGAEVDSRTLLSNKNSDIYVSNNLMMSYLQLAFPIATRKMEKRGMSWAVALGMRPISKINYKIEAPSDTTYKSKFGTINTLYEGSGGLNQINLSTGFRKAGLGKMKNELSIGISSGFSFGKKDIATTRSITPNPKDSAYYYKSNQQSSTVYTGVFIDLGMQYEMHFNNAGTLRIGDVIKIQQNLQSKETQSNQTIGYSGYGEQAIIDSIHNVDDIQSNVVIPTMISLGATYQTQNKKWTVGADFEYTNWKAYQNNNPTDSVNNNWTLRVGAEYYPAKGSAVNKNYLSFIKYRAGFYYGPNYVTTGGTRYDYALTGGFSFPLTTPRIIQSRGDYVTLNTSFEIGARGNKQSTGLRENYMRFAIGVSMNARWFQKRNYD